MPIYEFHCMDCGEEFELITQFADGRQVTECVNCGMTADRMVSVPAMQPDDLWAGHYDVTLGKHFDSKKRRDDYCKRKGYEVADSGAKNSAQDARARKLAAENAAREKAVAKVVQDTLI